MKPIADLFPSKSNKEILLRLIFKSSFLGREIVKPVNQQAGLTSVQLFNITPKLRRWRPSIIYKVSLNTPLWGMVDVSLLDHLWDNKRLLSFLLWTFCGQLLE